MDDSFAFMLLEVVSEIPRGKVASYSQLARMIGFPKNARKVGSVLSNANYFGNYPCHRVLRQDGRLVDGWKEQADLLSEEGVVCLQNGNVDMKKYQWKEN